MDIVVRNADTNQLSELKKQGSIVHYAPDNDSYYAFKSTSKWVLIQASSYICAIPTIIGDTKVYCEIGIAGANWIELRGKELVIMRPGDHITTTRKYKADKSIVVGLGAYADTMLQTDTFYDITTVETSREQETYPAIVTEITDISAFIGVPSCSSISPITIIIVILTFILTAVVIAEVARMHYRRVVSGDNPFW
jgi:hypothetical protein